MGIFNQLFGRNAKKSTRGTPEPNRGLHYEVIPENGPAFAKQYVDAVKNIEKYDLDYSAESIEFVDKFLQRFSDEGLEIKDFQETIFIAGCYLGQVMVNNNKGKWISIEESKFPSGSAAPLVIKFENDSYSNPIGKAFKRFQQGEGNDLRYFYHIATKDLE